jgi:hypothetical protein
MKRAVLMLIVCVAGAIPPAAHAEPPSNDLIENAEVIHQLPYMDEADYTEATDTGNEPMPCWNPAADAGLRDVPTMGGGYTLWYRYNATERVGLQAAGYRIVNENGFLDLSAYRLHPDGTLEPVGCASSDPYSNWTASIYIKASPGESYLFMTSMNTYPNDTVARFHMWSTRVADVQASRVSVAPVGHETDAGWVESREEFDVTYEAVNLSKVYTRTDLRIEICRVGLVEDPNCRVATGWFWMPSEGSARYTVRFTGLGIGDFVARLHVEPSFDIDPNDTNNDVETSFVAVAGGLGI